MVLIGLTVLLVSSSGVLIQCPPGSASNTLTDLPLGHICGGFCGDKGSCRMGLTCQKPCAAVEHPSASFVILQMGAPEPEGVCVDGPADSEVSMPGAPMDKGVCDAGVLAAAEQVCKVIDAQSNSIMSVQLVQVLSASSQVVAGVRWQLTLLAGPSTCQKATTYATCDSIVPEAGRDMYIATVYQAAWKPKPWHVASWKIMSRSWHNANVNTRSHAGLRKRRKRTLPTFKSAAHKSESGI